MDINIEGRIATYGRSGEELSNVGFALPEIPASSASMYLVSQEGGNEGDYEGVQVNGFDELFFKLPSSAGMDVTITSNSYCTIIPGSEYDVNAILFEDPFDIQRYSNWSLQCTWVVIFLL